ncbi:MAG TPA: response regulator transcription factor [Caulobacteraceae bacterium]|nr:response regulator transcription factor [Caulobacteraceae bacterium]
MRAIAVSRYPVCLDGLLRLLSEIAEPGQVVGASGLEDAVAQARDTPVDLMILDLANDEELPDLKRVVDAIAPAPLVLFAMLSPAQGQMAYETGVRGCLPKTVARELSVAALKLVLAGGHYFSDVGEFVGGARSASSLKGRLSGRQLEVLRLIELGQTNKEIAKALGISVATVKLHVQAILNVTGARNRTEAALRARGQIR